MSSRLDSFVVPMMGALTPGFERIHASEICAMLTPFFFASSSILNVRPSVVYLSPSNVCIKAYIPSGEFAQERHVVPASPRVRLAALGGVTSDTRQQATSERRPRDRADAKHLKEHYVLNICIAGVSMIVLTFSVGNISRSSSR